MKRLTGKSLQAAITDMREHNIPSNWEDWHKTHGAQNARVEFPLGELTNPNIAGYVWAWGMQHRIKTADITTLDRFNAQGLEGKVVVETSYTTALLVASELPEHRCTVYAN